MLQRSLSSWSDSELAFETMAMKYFHSYRHCVASIIDEQKFLQQQKTPTEDESKYWVQGCIDDKLPFYLGLLNNEVFAWCNIVRNPEIPRIANLGMGVLLKYRANGTGSFLLSLTLQAAKNTDLEEIQLDVFADNQKAVAMYRRYGFQVYKIRSDKSGRIIFKMFLRRFVEGKSFLPDILAV